MLLSVFADVAISFDMGDAGVKNHVCDTGKGFSTSGGFWYREWSGGYELHRIVDIICWASFGSGRTADLGGSQRRRCQACMREASMGVGTS